MNIKEIALRVWEVQARESYPDSGGELVVKFAEALVAEIQRQSEPVAEVVWFDPALAMSTESAGKIIDGSMQFMDSVPIGTKLFTFPPDKAQIEQAATKPLEEENAVLQNKIKVLQDTLEAEQVVHEYHCGLLTTAEQRVAEAWQPIETAPKDTFVLLAGPSGYTTIETVFATGRMCSDYHKGRWIDHANDDLMDWGFKPTHWMPLPNPPATGASL